MTRPACRLCRLSVGPLVRPCRCPAPDDLVHRHCLATWARVCRLTRCPLCKHRLHSPLDTFGSFLERHRSALLILLLLPVTLILTGTVFLLLTVCAKDNNSKTMLMVLAASCVLAIGYILYLLVIAPEPPVTYEMKVHFLKSTERKPLLSPVPVV